LKDARTNKKETFLKEQCRQEALKNMLLNFNLKTTMQKNDKEIYIKKIPWSIGRIFTQAISLAVSFADLQNSLVNKERC
jgi:hypothetical protein